MATDTRQLAHDRLAALAEERRRAADQLLPLSATGRNRLHEEVSRRREGEAGTLETPAGRPGWFARWRGVLPWIAVGAAVVPFLVIVFFPEPAAQVAQTSRKQAPANPVEAATSLMVNLAIPTSPSIPDLPRDAIPASAKATAPVTVTVRATSSSEVPQLRLGAVQRVRQKYHAVNEALPAAAPVLREFEVVIQGRRVELHDRDGSIYGGRVGPWVTSRSTTPEWTYEASGFNRSLGQPLWITGNFGGGDPAAPGQDVSGTEKARSAPVLRTDAFLEFPLTATVLVNRTNIFELRAEPAEP